MVDLCARRVGVLVLATLGVVALGERGAGAQVLGRFETVAATGQGLPAGGGVGTLSTFISPVINESGTVVFSAVLAGTAGGTADNSGVFIRTAAGVTRFVAREGQAAPDGNGTFGSLELSSTRLNDSDVAGFQTSLLGTVGGSLDNSTLLLYRLATTSLVIPAREGGSAITGEFGSFSRFAVGSDDAMVFSAGLRNTPNGASDDFGLFASSGGGGLSVIAREGASTPSGGTFGTINFQFSARSSTAVAFATTVLGVPGLTSALYRGNSLNRVELAREGQSVPGGGGAFGPLGFAEPVLNELGQVLFVCDLTGTANGTTDDSGVFRTDGTTTVTILREGQLAPKGGGTVDTIVDTRHNDRGQAAVAVVLTGTPGGSSDNFGYYLGSGSTLVELARSGNPVPGGDGVFDLRAEDFVLSNAGFLAFITGIDDTSGPNTNEGIYLSDGVDTIEVARKGSSFGGSTISLLSLRTSESATESSINESGQVVYRVTLANSAQQVVLFTPDLRYRSAVSGSWDTASRWTLGITPNALHNVTIDPVVSVTVSGPAGPVTVRSLTVGGANGIGTLSLAGGAITATNGVTVGAKGVLTGDGTVVGAVTNGGTVRGTNLTISGAMTNNGTVLAEGLTVTGTLTNNGIVTGNGRITAPLVNTTAGEIRVEAGAHLILGGSSLSNAGRVDLLGTPTSPAELEANVLFSNAVSTGLIAGRNAILRFDGGLNNAGSVALSSGVSDVFGDINNVATGRISITGGAAATFYDDVTQNGIMRVATVGNTRSVAVFLGGFTGAGGSTGGGDIFFEGDLRPGNSPAFVNFDANVSFGPGVTTFMELGGLGDGQYDRITVSGVLALDGALDVRFLAGLEPSGGAPVTYRLLQAGALVGDFDSILLPTLVGRDWFVQRTDTSLTIGSFTVIPEPGVVGVVAVGVGIVGMRRRR